MNIVWTESFFTQKKVNREKDEILEAEYDHTIKELFKLSCAFLRKALTGPSAQT